MEVQGWGRGHSLGKLTMGVQAGAGPCTLGAALIEIIPVDQASEN